jgi:glycosyltransferase involved in cell wall biosynthesis
MKLLVVGHSYITAFAQAKYVAMKTVRPDLGLRVVIPSVVRTMLGAYRPELADGLDREELVVLRSFGNTNMSYVVDPVALGSTLRQFEPTHIHIEEDPHSVIGSETVWLANRICPSANISFFTWDNLNRTPSFPLSVMKRSLTRFGFSRSRLIVCGNEEARALLASKGYRGASEVIPQIGMDPAAALGAGASAGNGQKQIPTIGFLGRLVEEKGLLDLLQALTLVDELPWNLNVIGTGPLRGEIEGRWQERFAGRLTYREAIPHAEVSRQLSLVDIFVLPSYTIDTWKEQYGLTLAQAMMAGCACIGSSSGAIPEVLGGTGLVFPERNIAALAEALRALLSSAAERARVGCECRGFALKNYTHESIAGRYLRAFDSVSN